MKTLIISAVLLISLALVGCDSNDSGSTTNEIEKVVMLPRIAEIQVGGTREFELVPVTASGDSIRDLEMDVRWWSTDTTVFTVTEDGMATAVDTGSAFCMAEVDEIGKVRRFVGRDSASVIVFMF